MKKIFLLFIWSLLILGLSSCSTDDSKKLEEANTQLNQENSTLKDENTQLKQELESLKKQSTTDSIQTNTGSIAEKEVQKIEDTVSKEDIKLAWCEETKKVGNTEWCMKNSQLVKEVEWYETRFSKSAQDDSGFKGIYETDNEDKLYTFEYLEKACGIIEWEWLSMDGTMKKTCPCPVWYHIPSPKEWNDTYSVYKENVNLFKSELWFGKIAWNRSAGGYILKYTTNSSSVRDANGYQTSALWSDSNISQMTVVWKEKLYSAWTAKWDAFALRCVKNN